MSTTVLSPEGIEKKKICEYLDSIGAWYCKPMTYGYGGSGVPDIIACLNGLLIAIEVKRAGKKRPTAIQQRRLNQIREASGFTAWGSANSVIAQLRTVLKL